MGAVTVRLYAAAAEAAGAHQLSVPLTGDRIALGELVAGLRREDPQTGNGAPSLQRVCAQSSFLINGTRAEQDSAEVNPGDTVDVLPPFAGG